MAVRSAILQRLRGRLQQLGDGRWATNRSVAAISLAVAGGPREAYVRGALTRSQRSMRCQAASTRAVTAASGPSRRGCGGRPVGQTVPGGCGVGGAGSTWDNRALDGLGSGCPDDGGANWLMSPLCSPMVQPLSRTRAVAAAIQETG